jgi:DNA polymerase-3 subunit delta'
MFSPNHHSYFLEGDRGYILAVLKNFLSGTWNMKFSGNPDVVFIERETLSVEDSRVIKETSILKPIGLRKVFIIATNFMGHEAQNALLKTLEEPSPDTFFFIIAPSSSILLPTVRSRVIVEKISSSNSEETESKEFLKSGFERRMKILSVFSSHENESRKSELLNFLNEIEDELARSEGTEKNKKSFEILLKMKEYLYMRSPSSKMISEYLALMLPKIK